MNFTPEAFLTSLVTGSIGYVYWSYGRKRPAPVFMAAGALLMIFPYFVESIALSVLIAALLAGIPFVLRM
jgi:hypothetical protein